MKLNIVPAVIMSNITSTILQQQKAEERLAEKADLDAQSAQRQVDEALRRLQIELGSSSALTPATPDLNAPANHLAASPAAFRNTSSELVRVAKAVPPATLGFLGDELGGVWDQAVLTSFLMVPAALFGLKPILAVFVIGTVYGMAKEFPNAVRDVKRTLAKPEP